MKVKAVYIWTNGLCMVIGQDGEQVPELQGRFGKMAPLISDLADDSTEFWYAKWHGDAIQIVDKASFDRLWKDRA